MHTYITEDDFFYYSEVILKNSTALIHSGIGLPKASVRAAQSHSTVEKQIPKNAEATTVLVGSSSELSTPAGAFVRLLRGCTMGNLAEVCIPVRFLFILLGPEKESLNYHEIGRCFATMMSDKVFLDCAYLAEVSESFKSFQRTFLFRDLVARPERAHSK